MDIEDILLEIEGKSSRQIWYAEHLRHKYIELHEDRFNDIYEAVMLENDKRNLDYNDSYLSTFDIELQNLRKLYYFQIMLEA